jgi:hypothetical protein
MRIPNLIILLVNAILFISLNAFQHLQNVISLLNTEKQNNLIRFNYAYIYHF